MPMAVEEAVVVEREEDLPVVWHKAWEAQMVRAQDRVLGGSCDLKCSCWRRWRHHGRVAMRARQRGLRQREAEGGHAGLGPGGPLSSMEDEKAEHRARGYSSPRGFKIYR